MTNDNPPKKARFGQQPEHSKPLCVLKKRDRHSSPDTGWQETEKSPLALTPNSSVSNAGVCPNRLSAEIAGPLDSHERSPAGSEEIGNAGQTWLPRPSLPRLVLWYDMDVSVVPLSIFTERVLHSLCRIRGGYTADIEIKFPLRRQHRALKRFCLKLTIVGQTIMLRLLPWIVPV